VRSGAKALGAVQFRGPLEARVEFDFRQWGKLQMALAGGSEHMNVLAPARARRRRLREERRRPAVAVLAGSTANQLFWGGRGEWFHGGDPARRGRGLSATDWVCGIGDLGGVCEQCGGGESGCELRAASDVQRGACGGSDGDLGRAGTAAAWEERRRRERRRRWWWHLWTGKAGRSFQEWSALFVAEQESGGRVCFYYPRLSPNPGAGSSGVSWDGSGGSEPEFGGGARRQAGPRERRRAI
jgi:hypothetical protein